MNRAFNTSRPWLPAVTPPPYLLLAVLLAVMAVLVLGGCGDGGGQNSGGTNPGVYANRVIGTPNIIVPDGVTAEQWPYFFQTSAVIGPPLGTFDVLSLGYDPLALTPTLGGNVTVGLGDHNDSTDRVCAIDGEGVDLAVFENPFAAYDAGSELTGTNSEVVTIEVSEDNTDWYHIPWSVDTNRGLVEPQRYTNLGGVIPISEGGDVFDLADAIAYHGLPADFQACYIRLTDGGTAIDDYGNFQTDQFKSGADIDAVGAFHVTPSSGLTP